MVAVSAVLAAGTAIRAGVLKQYQVDRFLAFTNPDLDPRGAGYNVEQARIAVGNGGWFGNGLLHGSQTRSANSVESALVSPQTPCLAAEIGAPS